MQNLIRRLMIAIVFILIKINASFAMEVAITVDDLPSNGDLSKGSTRLDVAKKILTVFKKHHINGVYGFINGDKLNYILDGKNILNEWISAGHYLGNHTYHHIDLAKYDSYQFIVDIQKNESILAELMRYKNYHYFRYPFLAEGNSQDKRDTIRKFLFKNNYQIAPVTVDFFDYEWNDAYVRCLNLRDEKSIAWLKKSYIEQANNALIIAHELSQMLFNRDIKNILLIHINSIGADMLDELLTSYENQNVKFIALSDALNDDIYQVNSNVVRERSYTFLNQLRLARGLRNPDIVEKLYNSLPEEKLNKICR